MLMKMLCVSTNTAGHFLPVDHGGCNKFGEISPCDIGVSQENISGKQMKVCNGSAP
jgi:hypothetical protein